MPNANKHHQNARGGVSVEPSDSREVYERSVLGSDGHWWGVGANGQLYRFSRESNGQTHFNGMTGGQAPLPQQEIPNAVEKHFNWRR